MAASPGCCPASRAGGRPACGSWWRSTGTQPRVRRAAVGSRPGSSSTTPGSRSADDLIIDLLSRQPFDARARSVVVTRDRDLLDARPSGRGPDPVAGLAGQPAGRPRLRGPLGVAAPSAAASGRAGRRARPRPAPQQDDERPAWRQRSRCHSQAGQPPSRRQGATTTLDCRHAHGCRAPGPLERLPRLAEHRARAQLGWPDRAAADGPRPLRHRPHRLAAGSGLGMAPPAAPARPRPAQPGTSLARPARRRRHAASSPPTCPTARNTPSSTRLGHAAVPSTRRPWSWPARWTAPSGRRTSRPAPPAARASPSGPARARSLVASAGGPPEGGAAAA